MPLKIELVLFTYILTSVVNHILFILIYELVSPYIST